MKVLILDNYDSFTYNLFHYLKIFIDDVEVHRNDEITLDQIQGFTHLVLSPGPGLPGESGILKQAIEHFKYTKPILGICLGMQAIGEVFGGSLYNQKIVKHGLQEEIDLLVTNTGLFKGLNNSTEVGLYHSWALDKDKLPPELIVTSKSKSDVVMSVQHSELPIYGVQFHPESILTPMGKKIIENWIEETDNE